MVLSVVSTTTNRSRAPGAWNEASAGFGCTHGALVGLSGGRTRTVTVSATLSNNPSLTTSENSRSVRTVGAVKVGVAVVAPLSVTVGPPVCVHW